MPTLSSTALSSIRPSSRRPGRDDRCCPSSACRCRPTSSTAPSTSTASACPAAGPTTRRSPRSAARGEGFVWIGLHEPDRRADHRHRRGLRAARAGRRGRRARPPAAQAGALRRHAVHGAQDGPLRRARRADHGHRDRRDRRGDGLRRPRLRRSPSGTASTPALHDVRAQLEADPEQLALGPAAVLHAIADHIVDSYLDGHRRHRGRHRRDGGARCSSPRSAMDSEQIYVMKREVLELRRAVVPLGGAAAQAHRGLQLAGAARGALLLPRRRRPPRHRHRAGDRLRRAAHHAGRRRAREDHLRQNNDMRKITA